MRIVIVGAGSIGKQIARELVNEKRDVVVIEKNAETARIADNELDCLVINDDGSRPEVLRQVSAGTADWFIALTGSDAVNLVACGLVAAESSKTRTIARVETPFYAALSPAQQKTFGLDFLLNPAQETARSLIRIIGEGFAESVVPLHQGDLQLRSVPATFLESYIGKTLGEIRHSSIKHFIIAAVVRNGSIIIPKGDCRIEEHDFLYVLGPPDSLNGLLGAISGLDDQARRILILGASKIAERFLDSFRDALASGEPISENKRKSRLSRFIRRVFVRQPEMTLLEMAEGEAKRMLQTYQDIHVVCGDSSDEGVLEGAGISRADLFIAATDSQSKNILTAQLAKVLGVKKSIAITYNERFLPLRNSIEVDSLISLNDSVAAAVLEIVRKAHIRTIFSFFEDEVEIVELTVGKDSPVSGKKLKTIDLPRDVLIAFVTKFGEIIVPNGETELEDGDEIGLVTRKDYMGILESIFGGTHGN